MFNSSICRIKSLFQKVDEGVIIADREEFAKETKEDFKGNQELLKAIENGMNRNARKKEYVSLSD